MRRLEITANVPGTQALPPIGFSADEIEALIKLLQPLPKIQGNDALREIGNKMLMVLEGGGIDVKTRR